MKENENIEEMPIIEEKRFFTKKRLIAGGIAAGVIAAITGFVAFVVKPSFPEIGTIEDNDDES